MDKNQFIPAGNLPQASSSPPEQGDKYGEILQESHADSATQLAPPASGAAALTANIWNYLKLQISPVNLFVTLPTQCYLAWDDNTKQILARYMR
jgi:hypothetical protein